MKEAEETLGKMGKYGAVEATTYFRGNIDAEECA